MSDRSDRAPEEVSSDAEALTAGSHDSVERLLARAVHAPAIPAPLTPGATIADRYLVERVLGSGGMGTVYLAHDRSLDRLVALKLHRTVAASDRLRQEALAMAKLAHPNAVTVYEVGELDGRTFVAMEYVSGATLRAWLAERQRTTRAILEALLAAGEGLAAAHASGLVHRDVKPDNILVGTDRRVRIGDFGLAQVPAPTERVAGLLGEGTATGTVLGTPAYMAPEQLDGGELDARTDQFSFCVTVWEALCGDRPYRGETATELRAAIATGRPRTGRRRIAHRLRRVLLRGLAEDPRARWRSLAALLTALRSAERRPRVLAAITVGCLVGALVAWTLWPAADPEAACADAPDELAVTLPPDTTAKLVAAVRGTQDRYAAERADAIERAVTRMRDRHQMLAKAACHARARRQWSPELAAAARECRDVNARVAAELLELPMAHAELVQVAAALPSFAACGDARVLAGWRQLGAEVPVRAKLDAAWTVLTNGGKPGVARRLSGAVSSADPETARRRSLLEAAIRRVVGASNADDEHALSEIYFAARASDDGELALRTLYELLSLVATVRRDAEATQRWIGNALADAEREHVRQPDLAALVVTTAASAAAIAGESDVAIERATIAQSFFDPADAPLLAVQLASVQATALADLGKLDESLARSDFEIATLQRVLGDHHPRVAGAYSQRVQLLVEGGRNAAALEATQRAREIIDTQHVDSMSLVTAQINIGMALLATEQRDGASYLRAARASVVAQFGEQHPDVALIDTNLALALIDDGQLEAAADLLVKAVAIQERMLGPRSPDLATALYNLAVVERQTKRWDAAIANARRALAIFAERGPGSARHGVALCHLAMILNLAGQPIEALATATAAIAITGEHGPSEYRAWARQEAARARIALGREPRETRRLLVEARGLFAVAALPPRVAECDELLRRLR